MVLSMLHSMVPYGKNENKQRERSMKVKGNVLEQIARMNGDN